MIFDTSLVLFHDALSVWTVWGKRKIEGQSGQHRPPSDWLQPVRPRGRSSSHGG
jgi:hypothetical protein